MKKSYLFLTVLFITFFGINGTAQKTTVHELRTTILKMDSLLFEETFNNCNTELLYKLTDSNFEFYHDQSGITYGQENFVESIRNNICSLEYRPFRKLVKETTEVYPLYDGGELYGAIQTGRHLFYAREEGRDPYVTSTAQFTHLWVLKEGNWILRRVLSYDHQRPDKGS